ncbi:hypothetical protein [Desulfotruncus alcoholivorax]|uniref:hypothetical protein n=1 Tax=Desulfotruncus alcoholivorax TaxID=265477 RepID=UPI0003FE74C2|nr:hypothetical protein [Desulfotruncus alcoholivorax]
MAPRSLWALLILVIFLAGCSLPKLSAVDKGVAADQQASGKEKNKQTKTPDIAVAAPLPGQNESTVYTVDQYNKNISDVKLALNTLIDSLIINDLSKAQSCMIGLDESGGEITIEKLQQEMEKLHPVEWQLKDFHPVGSDKALVEVDYTMSDGTVRSTEPFSVINLGDQWAVHFNSFAMSFHGVASHMIKDLKKQG